MRLATRSKTVTIRMAPETFAAAEIAAHVTGRTVSSLTEYALRVFIQRECPEAFTPGARVTFVIQEPSKEGA